MNVYIITGASRGLGAHLVRQLCGENTLLVCVSRTKNIEIVATGEQKGAQFIWHEINLADTGTLLSQAQDIFPLPFKVGKIDEITLINNAAVVEPIGPVGIFDTKRGMTALSLNITAVTVLSSFFISTYKGLPAVKRIVNITSGAAQQAIPGLSLYCASKAAVDMFTRTIAEEQKDEEFPVSVTAVSPGMTETEMQERLRRASDDRLPTKSFYINAHKNGEVISPESAAEKIITYFLSGFQNGSIVRL